MHPAPLCTAGAARGLALLNLAKPRLGMLVLFATAAGYWMGGGGKFARLAAVLVGTGLVSGGAAMLNQVLELKWDRLMARTRERPLPSGRVSRSWALLWGSAMAMAGASILALGATPQAAGLAALAFAIYLAGYTPLKRRSPACVLVGAVAGALPPVIGWAGVNGSLQWGSAWLFGVVFTWQMPHLLAIAWMHRDEYASAGFALLRQDDPTGEATAWTAMLFSLLLAGWTMLPVPLALTGGPYLAGVLCLNGLLLSCTGVFLAARSRESARRLFIASIIYLPGILALILLTQSLQR